MAIYTLEPEQGILHGSFSREFPSVLSIDSGDTVVFRTLDVGWGLEPWKAREIPHQTFHPRVPGRDDGHALCGPVAIRGARPGMTLEVRINEIRPGPWGWTTAGGRVTEITKKLGIEQPTLLAWTLDADTMIGRDQYGRSIPLRPFIGVMGLPPDEPGIHSTVPARTEARAERLAARAVCRSYWPLPSLCVARTLSRIRLHQETSPGERGAWPRTSSPTASPPGGAAPVAEAEHTSPIVEEAPTSPPVPVQPVRWGDWPRCQIRRTFVHLLRTQTVLISFRTTETLVHAKPHAPSLETRAARAHWRIS